MYFIPLNDDDIKNTDHYARDILLEILSENEYFEYYGKYIKKNIGI